MTARLRASFGFVHPSGFRVQVDDLTAGGDAPVTVLIGPSGSGKSTMLRCLAGLEQPRQGSIRCGDATWLDTGQNVHWSPQRRRIGFLFQDLALFPHLTAVENVAFGLRAVPRGQRTARAAAALDRLSMGPFTGRRPGELSGGQQQRVALARILAFEPALLLLDEPLSALDPPLRARLRADLRQLLDEIRVPAVIVTHDRTEALALADRVAVVVEGGIRQQGPVAEVFRSPADLAVAEVVGTDCVLPAQVAAVRDGIATLRIGTAEIVAPAPASPTDQVFACIRAEEVLLQITPPGASSARNRLPGRVTAVVAEGALLRIGLDCGFPLAAMVTPAAAAELGLQPGAEVFALIKASAIHLVPAR